MHVHLNNNVNDGSDKTDRINESNKNTVIRKYTQNCNYLKCILCVLCFYRNINFYYTLIYYKCM